MKNKKLLIIIFAIFSSLFFQTIAYSALSSTMIVTGKAFARVEADVRITDFRIKEITGNTTINYTNFTKDTISTDIIIEGTITYTVEITNYGTNDVGIESITGLPTDLVMVTEGYNIQEKLCNENGKCNSLSIKEFDIKISTGPYTGWAEETFTLKFNFQPYYQISYVNIDNSNYPTEVLGGTTLNLNMSDNPPKLTAVRNSSGKINSVYANNVLSVPTVTENIEIEGAYQTEYTYGFTGEEQLFQVLNNGNYKFELWGASGTIHSQVHAETVGNGGYTSGNLTLLKGKRFYIYVGSGNNNQFNGGAPGEAPGGGSTDIRTVNGNWNSFESLKSRIMVAGAGGGGVIKSYNNMAHTYVGDSPGHGGGLNGYDANYNPDDVGFGYSGYGATQTQGGSPGKSSGVYELVDTCYGQFGKGGYIIRAGGIYASSGGGSGYYGGGHGVHPGSSWTGGGGGSSFISGHNGCDAISSSSTETNIIHTGQSIHYSNYQFTDTVMVDGKGYNWTTEIGEYTGMPTHDGTDTMVGNIGDGYAKITLLEIN